MDLYINMLFVWGQKKAHSIILYVVPLAKFIYAR
jgi:hypothetical protein